MEHLRFEAQARDLKVDQAQREAWMRRSGPANRCYVILFSARSGSSWLTGVLSATGRLGKPEEYINPEFVRDVATQMQADTAPDLLAALTCLRRTPNGVFGLECRAVDVRLLGEAAFRAAFAGEAIFFHLWRENVVAQGISLYRAIATGLFHSAGQDRAAPPAFDPKAMLHWIHHLVVTENENVGLLGAFKVPARHLRYERIIANREQTVEAFAHALAVPFRPGEFAAPPEGELRKLGDDWNEAAEARLRREQSGAIAALEAARLVCHGVAGNPHPPPPDPSAPPALREAYERGLRSGGAGRSPRNNPYEADSAEHAGWVQGWRRGWDGQIYR